LILNFVPLTETDDSHQKNENYPTLVWSLSSWSKARKEISSTGWGVVGNVLNRMGLMFHVMEKVFVKNNSWKQ
jgi:hypothetical protein